MELTIIPIASLLIFHFLSGRLFVDYGRLISFIAVVVCASCSLLLNFAKTMLPSFLLFVFLYSLLTLFRPTTTDQNRATLKAYQSITQILSILAVLQFLAQLFVDGRQIINFFDVLPRFFFTERFNTIIPVVPGSALIKSNAVFLSEPSTLSQIVALAVLIEILEFRRTIYLCLFISTLFLAYSGTGLMIVLGFVPIALLYRKNARLPACLAISAAALLIVTGTIDISAFTSRLGEFENAHASGFQRFVSPLWLAMENFRTASLQALLIGHGPGTTDAYAADNWYVGFAATWLKLIYEYGIIGLIVVAYFFISCLRSTQCPPLLVGAIMFGFLFLGGHLLSVEAITLIVVFCTLNRPGLRRREADAHDAQRGCTPVTGGTAT